MPAADAPVIVLGVRRSGTTLLRVMLDRNPALAVPDESYFVPQLARRHRGTVDPAAFVEDYYGHLPDDTETAWALLSKDMQDEVGGYDSYAGFWRTISAVQVEGTKPVDASTVDVELTYTSDRGTEKETRRISLQPDGDSFVIVADKVV